MSSIFCTNWVLTNTFSSSSSFFSLATKRWEKELKKMVNKHHYAIVKSLWIRKWARKSTLKNLAFIALYAKILLAKYPYANIILRYVKALLGSRWFLTWLFCWFNGDRMRERDGNNGSQRMERLCKFMMRIRLSIGGIIDVCTLITFSLSILFVFYDEASMALR